MDNRRSGNIVAAPILALAATMAIFAKLTQYGPIREANLVLLERLGSTDVCLREDMRPQFLDVPKEELDRVLGITPALDAAWRELDRANEYWKKGEHSVTITIWQDVIRDHLETNVAFAAQQNIAMVHRFKDGPRAAIREYITHAGTVRTA